MKTRFRTCKIAKFGNFGLIGLSPLPYIFKHAHRNLSCRIVFKSLVIGSKLNMYRRTWVLFGHGPGATSMQADDEKQNISAYKPKYTTALSCVFLEFIS